MLELVGAASLDALAAEAIPESIRLQAPLDLPAGQSEHRYLRDLRDVAARNQEFRSYIGLGYYDCVTPSVIQRNVLENPGWYTPYTPYQAEIAQGRLEGLLTFQTMVADLTGMEIANASLLDEATAAAEAMTMLHRLQAKRVEKAGGRAVFFVAGSCFPQTIDVLRARAEPLGIELAIGEPESAELGADVFGALLQTPDEAGQRARLLGLRDTRAAGRRARRRRLRSPGVDAAAASRRMGRGRGRRQLAAIRRAAGIRRAARGVLRDPRSLRPPDAGPHHRRVGRCARPHGVPDGAADARTAHPPREGDVEHLHGRGAAGEHRRVLRRLPRPGRPRGHRPTDPGRSRPGSRAISRRSASAS